MSKTKTLRIKRLRKELVSIAEAVYEQQDRKAIDEIEKYIEIQVDFFAKDLEQTIKKEWKKRLELFFVNMNGVKKKDENGTYKEAFFVMDDYPNINLYSDGLVVIRGCIHFILLDESDILQDSMEGILIW